MNLEDFLGPKPTIVDLCAKSPWEAIDELVQRLVVDQKIESEHSPAVVTCLRQRESLGATGLGKGVAIPHATTDLVSDLVVALGRSTEGVSFVSPDGKPSHTIVLFLVPRNQFQKHLKTLANIAKLFGVDQRARY